MYEMDTCTSEANFRNVLKTFAGEVFDFFLSNVKIWEQNPECLPLYDLFIERKNISFFHADVKKAVLTLAYLFRTECRKKFREMSDELKDVENFENYAMRCCIPRLNYMSNFFSWIAFLLELTTYCYTKGYNYSEAGQRCLVKYPDAIFFCGEGGWKKFYETADLIAVFYQRLITSFYGKFPECDILAPFLKALDDIFRFAKYEDNTSKIERFRDSESRRRVERELPIKLRAVLPYDPQRIRFGCLITKKNECLDKSRGRRKVCSPKFERLTTQNIKLKFWSRREGVLSKASSQSENLTASEGSTSTHLEDKAGHETEIEPLLASAVSSLSLTESYSKVYEPKLCTEFDYTNSMFIITDRYLKLRQNATKKGQKSKCKVDIKVYSPSKKRTSVIEKLDETLDDNIDKNNISPLAGGVLAIGPPGGKDKRDDYRLIVLNSSSEEEDDEFDPIQRSVMLHVYQDWPELAPGHIMIMKSLTKWRVWEASRLPNQKESSGILTEAAAGMRAVLQPLSGYNKATADDLSGEFSSARDLQTSDRRIFGPDRRTEWLKKSVYRD